MRVDQYSFMILPWCVYLNSIIGRLFLKAVTSYLEHNIIILC